MMYLEMHLDGKLIDTIKVHPLYLRPDSTLHLHDLRKEMLKKHPDILSDAELRPVFVLSGVPSSMNVFVPLKHPEESTPVTSL